jgi:hypothetical protein
MNITSLTRRIREMGNEALERIYVDISGSIQHVNNLKDSGTVLEYSDTRILGYSDTRVLQFDAFHAFHAIIVDPNSPEFILTLNTYENLNCNHEKDEVADLELIHQIYDHDIELVNRYNISLKYTISILDGSCRKLNHQMFKSWIIITIVLTYPLQSLHPVFENDI